MASYIGRVSCTRALRADEASCRRAKGSFRPVPPLPASEPLPPPLQSASLGHSENAQFAGKPVAPAAVDPAKAVQRRALGDLTNAAAAAAKPGAVKAVSASHGPLDPQRSRRSPGVATARVSGIPRVSSRAQWIEYGMILPYKRDAYAYPRQ
jgi:hypothetical protein